jgi:hypothetical protein
MDRSMSEQLLASAVFSPIFMIFILQVDIHEVKVFPKFQLFIATESIHIKEISSFSTWQAIFTHTLAHAHTHNISII